MAYLLEQCTNKKVLAGKEAPLGATLNRSGVNFAICSKYAKEIFLLLFDEPDGNPRDIIKLEHRSGDVWHAFVQGVKGGQIYAYKVKGDYSPAEGMRFNESKLLIDPYAKALTAECKDTDNLLHAYDLNAPDKDLIIDKRDNTSVASKAVVINDNFDWQGDSHPNIPVEKLIVYEVNVKGFTAHKSSGVKYPGTYLGFIEKIPYLKDLGINAVELLPICAFYKRDFLVSKNLSEYWGYNTISFFAPEISHSSCRSLGCQVNEFKTLVREMHKAGIEVILDVVYNHTGEGNELGPTLSFKGLDNPVYYTLQGTPDEPYRYYRNDTGCGNTFNVEHPRVLRLIIDSLRYWVEVMRVDGFRFDMASVLARVGGEFHKESAFFDAISKDSVLKKVKMIAEPWDLSTYQVGNFPLNWSEWNGKFRDTVRRFVKGDSGQVKKMAWRLTGSSDLYGDDGRSPYNSVNFVTCHDGFSLYDLYSYNYKHNKANGEDNRDGVDENHSWNCGFEGETENAEIIGLRKQLIKNVICCLFFSLGTPMLLSGDECFRTQEGNNNAYCQDNEISWLNWAYAKKNKDIFEFCKKAIAFRKLYTILQRRKFFLGKDMDNDNVLDITWFGENLDKPSWDNEELKILCFQLDGSESPSDLGNYHLFFILNADHKDQLVKLPHYEGMKWYRVVDTSLRGSDDFLSPGQELLIDPSDHYQIKPRAIAALLGK